MFHRFHPGLKISNTVLQFLKVGDLNKEISNVEENPTYTQKSPSNSSAKKQVDITENNGMIQVDGASSSEDENTDRNLTSL